MSYFPSSAPNWAIRDLPRWLQGVITCVVTIYCAAIAAAVATTRIQPGQFRLFGVLLACSAVAVEVTRRVGEPTGVVRDVYALWDLPVAVLLPPLYALLAPVPRMILTQLRVRRSLPHRRIYTAAAVGLAYAAASMVFHSTVPALGPGAGTGTGEGTLLWTMLACACGLLRLAINDALILAAVKGSAPETRLLPEIAGPEAVYGSITELSLGTLAAYAAAHSMLTILYAIPAVIALERSLRHKQLVSQTRIDGKTRVLNDGTWRREAAIEMARAARSRTPVTIGVVDIDHFKAVNDTYGHATGDAVLVAVAAAIVERLREYDIVGRIGGEEFGFLLPSTPVSEAIEVAERLRQGIPGISVPQPGSPGAAAPRVTVSIGLAATDFPRLDLGAYFSLADQALYAAKVSRDAVWFINDSEAGPSEPEPALSRASAEAVPPL